MRPTPGPGVPRGMAVLVKHCGTGGGIRRLTRTGTLRRQQEAWEREAVEAKLGDSQESAWQG